jgi:hypothetical protein
MDNSKAISKDLLRFLNDADDLYIEAYQTRQYSILFELFTRECMNGIAYSVQQYGTTRYFAEKRFRSNTWEVLSEDDEMITIRKTQRFKRINYSLFRSMRVSEDYQEDWEILKDGGKHWRVASIGKDKIL